jgi:hypothetical protein
LVLFLLPDIHGFIDRLLNKTENVEPMLNYYQTPEIRLPEQAGMEPSELLEYVCSTVILDHVENYGQEPFDDTNTSLIPVMNVCLRPGNERICKTALACHPGATAIELYAKLLYHRPAMPFSKIEEG